MRLNFDDGRRPSEIGQRTIGLIQLLMDNRTNYDYTQQLARTLREAMMQLHEACPELRMNMQFTNIADIATTLFRIIDHHPNLEVFHERLQKLIVKTLLNKDTDGGGGSHTTDSQPRAGSGQRIAILGGSVTDENIIRDVYSEFQAPFSLDIQSDYRASKKSLRKYMNPNRYAGILAGPMVHKGKGIGRYSGQIKMLEAESPIPVVQITNEKGYLVMSKSALREAFRKIFQQLESVDLE